MLRSKQSGKYSQQIENNIGVFQGSPLSAILFIIYADYVMKKYDGKVKNANIKINKIRVRNQQVKDNLSGHLAKKIKASQECGIKNRNNEENQHGELPHSICSRKKPLTTYYMRTIPISDIMTSMEYYRSYKIQRI